MSARSGVYQQVGPEGRSARGRSRKGSGLLTKVSLRLDGDPGDTAGKGRT